MASKALGQQIRWSRNRGRDDWDIPTDIPDEMSAEALNVVLEKGTLGKRRRGSSSQTITGDTFVGATALFRFVPKAGEASAEVFIVSNDGTTKILRVAAGAAAANLTLKDAAQSAVVRSAVLNNKLYLAYNSAVNRLSVFSPDESTTVVRRVGHATPAAATVANTGSGSYAATIRYYRVAWLTKSGTTVLRQSLLGASVSFTPSGSGTHARVTQPTVASEGETHWRVYGSADDVLFYELADVAIGTTTYDDNETVADYDTNDPAPDEGAYTPWPSVKYLLSTGERLVGFGVYETAIGDSLLPKNGRVYFSPVLDSSDADDDERVSNTTDFQGWIDIARNAGSEDRALGGPIDNNIFVFQSKGTYLLIPTGEANDPYRRVLMHPDIGAVSQESVFMGEDETGRPALYWLDPVRGPYRYGKNGMEWIGYDIQTLWKTVNLAATSIVAAGAYDAEQRACVWWLATGASNTLAECITFYVREGQPTSVEGVRGGWVRLQEAAASAWLCLGLLPTSIAATMSRGLSLYTGSASTMVIRRWNAASTTDDAGTDFRAYVTSRAYQPLGLTRRFRLGRTVLQASAEGATITQSLARNFGDETARTDTESFTAAGSETRLVKKFDGAFQADANVLQATLGEAAVADQSWAIDEWVATFDPTEEL
jgi:hypothetical protein